MPPEPCIGAKTKVAGNGPVNVALPESPDAPVTVTVYGPLDPGATTKEPDIKPPDIVHTGPWMRPVGVEEIVQGPLSPGAAKFEPWTRTFVPACPEVGVIVTVAMTRKLAVPKSVNPSGVESGYPRTVMMVLPDGVAGDVGTVKVPLITPGPVTTQVIPEMGARGTGEPRKIWHDWSVKLKPVPVTVTEVPSGPAEGESVTDVVVTVKGTEIDPCCTKAALDMVTVCVT